MSKGSKRAYLEFEGFDEVVEKLRKLEADVEEVAEKALIETHKHVTQKAEEAMQPQYLPARGKYSKGTTLEYLKRDSEVEWSGSVASIETGFDVHGRGIVSIFLMYGTPKMAPDQKLYYAFYGKRIEREIREIQEKIFYEEIRRLEG